MPFAALNTPQNRHCSKSDEIAKCVTKEVLEAEAVASFQKSLKLQKDGLYTEAKEAYLQLLEGPFLASENGCKPKNSMARASVHLKYCVLKNLGITYEKLSESTHALDFYLKALIIDDSDVTLWLTIGKLAESSLNVSLTRFCYKMIQERNAEFEPSLMRDICILYATESYEECLEAIFNALKRDSNFLGGMIIMKQIYKFVPSLRKEIKGILRDCKINLASSDLPEQETLQILKDIKEMKDKFKNINQPVPQDIPNINHHISSPRWQNVGIFILNVCSSAYELDMGCSTLAYEVDLESCLKVDCNIETTGSHMPNVPVEVIHQNDYEIQNSNELPVCEDMQVDDMSCRVDEQQRCDTAESSREDKEQENVAVPDHLLAQAEKKKGKKRKMSMVFFDEPEFKRRSSRVKNPVRSKAVEMSESPGTIKNLLPNFFLRPELQEEDGSNEMLEETKNAVDFTIQSSSEYQRSVNIGEEEEEAVLNFVRQHPGKYSMAEIIRSYLLALQQLSCMQWSDDLKKTFMKCFEVLRINSEMEFITSSKCQEELTKICLVYLELKLELNLKEATKSDRQRIKEMKKSSSSSQFTTLKDRDLGENPVMYDLQVEIVYLEKGIRDLDEKLAIRAYWVLARIYKFLNVLDDSLYYYNETLELLKSSGVASIDIPNCRSGGIISQENINEVMNRVEKSSSIEEVNKIFERGEHRRVIELLADASLLHNEDLRSDEKRQQMLWVLESYAALDEYENCFAWVESTFNGALKLIYKCKDRCGTSIDVIKRCLDLVEICIRHLGPNMRCEKSYARFTSNLASLLEIIFEDADFKNSKDFESHAISMWILLHRLVKWCENVEKPENETEDIPHHLQVIISGHEHLGRKGWCSLNNGEYLLFLVNELKTEMEQTTNECFHSDITSALEQAFHCLYGHPSKKSRGRYLEDHSSHQIPLDWSGGQLLYKLFRPESLPEYDSYKTSAISSECATLLLKLKKLAPKIDNFDQLLDNVESYLNGTSDNVPVQPSQLNSLREEIFYLLGDFYFKNGETKKAMKYYIRDLSLCPNRLDSWAALALIHSSFLTDVLSEHDIKPDVDINPHVKPGLKSFERALSIDKSSSKLWIEYGSFAYVLHTHFSYLTKKGLNRESDRNEMLRLSGQCFEFARVNDTGSGEEWLEHYMLGKVAEKSHRDPEVFLEYYYKASEYLHLEKAKYPRRSFSYYNPPHLAVESLEMFYRIHASTMKYLIKYETRLEVVSFDVFEKYLKLCAESPLVRGTELQDKKKVDQIEEKDKMKLCESTTVDENEEVIQNFSENMESNSSSGADKKFLTNDNKSALEIEQMENELEIKKEETMNQAKETSEDDLEDQTPVEVQEGELAEEVIMTSEVIPLPTKNENLTSNIRTASKEERFTNLLNACVKAFSFILSRYPWHFKSTYRLAYLFFHCKKLRNLEACRALLVGHSYAPISSISKCNGLFCERKPSNFFNGLWRLPSTELDRCGSFSSHLCRSVHLLCDLCRALQDPRMLFFLHQQLARCPENAAKKYLRDHDREALSKHAFEDCCVVLKHQVENVLRNSDSMALSPVQDLLMRVFNIRQQCFKMSTKHLDSMMLQLFTIIFPNAADPVLDEVKRFCITQQNPRAYNVPLVQTTHFQTIQNAADVKRCITNNILGGINCPQRMSQMNQMPGNYVQKPDIKPEIVSERVMVGSSEVTKVNVSASADIEIIDEPEIPGPVVNTQIQIKQVPHSVTSQPPSSNINSSTSTQIQSKINPSHLQAQRHIAHPSNKSSIQNTMHRNLKEQSNSGLPVQLKLGPEVFPESVRHQRQPAPRLQPEFNPRTNQRPIFNHPLVEDEVIILSEDSECD